MNEHSDSKPFPGGSDTLSQTCLGADFGAVPDVARTPHEALQLLVDQAQELGMGYGPSAIAPASMSQSEMDANVLESCARWLTGHSATKWAEEGGHVAQMLQYADRLLEVRTNLAPRGANQASAGGAPASGTSHSSGSHGRSDVEQILIAALERIALNISGDWPAQVIAGNALHEYNARTPQRTAANRECPDAQRMGLQACADQPRCWAPCGALGSMTAAAPHVAHTGTASIVENRTTSDRSGNPTAEKS